MVKMKIIAKKQDFLKKSLIFASETKKDLVLT